MAKTSTKKKQTGKTAHSARKSVKRSAPARSTPRLTKPKAKTKPVKKPAGGVTVKPVKPAKPAKPVKPVVKAPPSVAPLLRRPAAPVVETDNGKAGPSAHLTEDQLRKVKTGLSKRDLEHYRSLLMTKRAEILGDVDSIQTDARSKSGSGNLSNMPVHMADIGTENYDQEFNLGLVESERKLLRQIDDALLRIEKGYYGVCVESGKPIARPRLDAKPWARYCIEVARERERRGESVT